MQGRNFEEIRLVASDIDGTLLDQENALSDALIAQIWRLYEKGVLFTFATGRLPYEVEHLFTRLPPMEVPYVAGNGSVLKGRNGYLIDRTFPTAPLRPILEKYAEGGTTVIFNIDALERPLRVTEWSREQAAQFAGMDNPVDSRIWDMRVRRMHIYDADAQQLRNCLWELQMLGDQMFSFGYQNPHSIQISAAGSTKQTGIRALSEYCRIPRERILCMGDSYSDIPMVSYAGIGAAVGNSCAELKAIADYVSPFPCGEGALDILQRI